MKCRKATYNYEGHFVAFHSLITGMLWTCRPPFALNPINLRLSEDLTHPN